MWAKYGERIYNKISQYDYKTRKRILYLMTALFFSMSMCGLIDLMIKLYMMKVSRFIFYIAIIYASSYTSFIYKAVLNCQKNIEKDMI